jgi:hypothetical protein
MTRIVLHAEQWETLRRLEAAGCPLDLEHLPRGSYPLRVFTEVSPWGTDVFPLANGTGIAFRLCMIATASITICKLQLQANWLKDDELSWSTPCRDHGQNHCFHNCIYGPRIRFQSDEVLNRRLVRWEILKRSDYLRGFWVGTFPGTLNDVAEAKLPATVVIEDLFGEQYPFSILLDNSKGIIEPPAPNYEGELM